jgi:DNA-directed RNA polymerase subunit RPC12/RpoP
MKRGSENMIEFKCGSCDTYFYIKREQYRERMMRLEQIQCPSCFDHAPFDIEYVVKRLVEMDDLRSWEVGTQFARSSQPADGEKEQK